MVVEWGEAGVEGDMYPGVRSVISVLIRLRLSIIKTPLSCDPISPIGGRLRRAARLVSALSINGY